MEELKQWLLRIIAFSFSAAMLHIFLPNDRISETVRSVVKAFMLIVLITPLIFGDINLSDVFDVPLKDTDAMTTVGADIANEMLLRETKSVMNHAIKSIVGRYYYDEYEVDTDVDILSDNRIHIKRIRLCFPRKTENEREILSALQNYFISCEIQIEQEVIDE